VTGAPGHEDEVAALRARFDEVDARLVALLVERARLAIEIGAVKRAAGRTLVDPAREAVVLERVAALARSPLTPDAARRIYQAVLAESRRLVAGPA